LAPDGDRDRDRDRDVDGEEYPAAPSEPAKSGRGGLRNSNGENAGEFEGLLKDAGSDEKGESVRDGVRDGDPEANDGGRDQREPEEPDVGGAVRLEGGAPPGFPPTDGAAENGKAAKGPGILESLRGRRALAILVVLALLLPAASWLYLRASERDRAEREREFQVLSWAVLRHVRAEENAVPPPPGSLTLVSDGLPQETRLLKEGAGAFAKGDFEKARDSFARLAELKPESEVQALLGAANLRASNFSLAKEQFSLLTDPPFGDPDIASSVGLGLALALFNLGDLEGALPHAEAAYADRLKRLGPASTETVSAANILGVLLISLGRTAEGEEILESAVKSALEGGHPPSTPVVTNALKILTQSYGMRDSGKDVFGLLPPEFADLAGTGTRAGRDGPLTGAPPAGDAAGERMLPPDDRRGDPPASDGRSAAGEAEGTEGPGATGGGERTGGAGAPDGPAGSEAADGSGTQESYAPEAGQAGGGAAGPAPPVSYPEMLAVYNGLSREYPHSPVRPALLEAMAASLDPSQGGAPCRDPGDVPARETLWHLCVSLADSLVSDGDYGRGFQATGELLRWPETGHGPLRHLVFRNAALQNSRDGELAGAEEFLRLALAAAASREELDPQDVAFIALRTITLADVILKQGKPSLEAEIELTASVTLLERKLPRRTLDTYPESPFLFWYLARVLRDEGRNGDAKSYFDRALRAASSASEAHPDSAPELSRLQDMLRADRSWRRGRRAPEQPPFPPSPRIFFEAEAEYAARPRRPPSPSALRQELQGLKLLGRIRDFEPRADEILASLEPGSPDYLRYQSVKLRYLEETREWRRLFAELRLMTADPPLEDPRARALFLSSAKSYEARMLIASGDPRGAASAYEEAAGLLDGVPDTDSARDGIAAELLKLRASTAPASGLTPAAGAAQYLAPAAGAGGAPPSAAEPRGDKAPGSPQAGDAPASPQEGQGQPLAQENPSP
jgi:tetratricopeptide (TPR) repeat protein